MAEDASTRERQMTHGHPRPVPDQNSAPFYEAARRGEIRFQRCADCGAFRHYPRPACPRCLSRRYEWERVTGRGTVYTWTVVRGPTLPDRVIAIDLIGVLIVCLLVALAAATAEQAFLDVGIVIALISFVGTVAYARYLEREGS